MVRPPSAAGTVSHRRPVTRLLAIACAGLGLLLVAAVAVIHTPLVRRYVLRQVTQLLASQQIAVETDELGYNLLDLSLSLRNVVVRAADPPGGDPPFASIGRARVDLSLFQLVRGHYVVESAVLEGVTVHYLVREDGTDNLPRPLRDPDAPSEPIAYLIDVLSTEDASVRYEDRLRQVDVTLPIARLAVDGNRVSGRHRIDVETTPSTATIRDRTARIDRVSGRFDLGQDDIAIEQLDASGEGAVIALTGAIDDFERPRAKLTLRATADVASAVRLAGLDQPATGALQLEAAIAGDLGAPAIDATVTGTALAVRGLEGMTVHAVVGYDAGARHALVRRVEAKAPFGELTAEGELAVEPTGTSRLRAEASGIDAAAIMRALDLEHGCRDTAGRHRRRLVARARLPRRHRRGARRTDPHGPAGHGVVGAGRRPCGRDRAGRAGREPARCVGRRRHHPRPGDGERAPPARWRPARAGWRRVAQHRGR